MKVGREALVHDLSNRLQASCRILLLLGMTGIGKTALAERLSLALAGWLQSARYPVFRLNFDHHEREKDFVSVAAQWLETWRESVTAEDRKNPKGMIRRLVNILRQNRGLVIIDAMEKVLTGAEGQPSNLLDEGWEQFFQSVLSAEMLEGRLIITSQDLPEQLARLGAQYPNRWLRQSLVGLVEAEQIALFEKVGLPAQSHTQSYAYLLRIGKAYGGHPLSLRAILGEIINDYAANVGAYWHRFGDEIEIVERALIEAQNPGKIQAAEDQWRLDRYSIELQRQVKYRLDQVFQRLKQRAPDAYLLLCAVSMRKPRRTQCFSFGI